MTDLLNAIALGLLALLPLTNPPTTAALFLTLCKGMSQKENNKEALMTSVYVFLIMTLTYYIGEIVMDVFNISIPGLRMAGGGILVIMGLKILFPAPKSAPSLQQTPSAGDSFAFIPLAMPGYVCAAQD